MTGPARPPRRPAVPRPSAPRTAAPRTAAPRAAPARARTRTAVPRPAPPRRRGGSPPYRPAHRRGGTGGGGGRRPPARHAGDSRRRLVALMVCLCLAFSALVTRLAFVQVVSADRYASLGPSQRQRAVVLAPERGSIFDRNGYELALSIPQKTVWADPRLVDDPVGTARALAPVLGVPEDELAGRLSRRGAFVYLARKVEDDVAARVEDLELPGVALLDESKRFTPAGGLGSSMLGRVGLDNQGLSGLELKYDHLLVGSPGELVVERDPHGLAIPSTDRRVRAPERGDDLVLTIDRSLQFEAERALAAQIVDTDARGGMAVVMNPRTGEILAMASLEAGDEQDPAPRPSPRNMAFTDVFEPGSVNKVITVAAALEEGVYRPSDVLTVPDNLKVSVKTFHDHDPHPPKEWSVTDILVNSSNIGTIMIAQKLGKPTVDRYLRAFGFGRPTAVRFPGESGGILLDTDEWTGPSIGAIPIGQGVAVTAVQMLMAYNTLANGGVYVEPKLVKATVDDEGEQHLTPPSRQRRVVSARTARRLTAMLVQVVDVGTGTPAAIEGYSVAGKTGTARKPSREFLGYEEGAYMSGFAGFVPAEDPQLSAIVVLDDPHPYYGGIVAGPVFADIARYGLRQFRIPPPPPAPDLVAAVPKAAAEDAARADGAAAGAATPAPAAPPRTAATTPPTVRSAPAPAPPAPTAPLLGGG